MIWEAPRGIDAADILAILFVLPLRALAVY
jgi:hypothetical protein